MKFFWVAFIATSSAMIIKLASLCFQSKCKECSVCGGRIRIIRDVESEERAREFELTHPPPPSPSKNDSTNNL